MPTTHAHIAERLARLTADTLDSTRAADEVALFHTETEIREYITLAARGKAASRETSLTRAQINLAGALCKLVGEAYAEAVARKHFRDERYWHIAVFTDRSGATAFMLELIA